MNSKDLLIQSAEAMLRKLKDDSLQVQCASRTECVKEYNWKDTDSPTWSNILYYRIKETK